MTEAAIEARKAYFKEYRERNKERIRNKEREWRINHPDKVKAAQERYWERKAQEIV